MMTQEQDKLHAALGLKEVAALLESEGLAGHGLLSAEDYNNAERIYWASMANANDPQIIPKMESLVERLLDFVNGLREDEAEDREMEKREWPDEIGS